MNIRIKIARWLAPEWDEQRRDNLAHINALRENLRRIGWEKAAARSTLQAIAARNTPNASHTVKKIVAMAEEALR